MAPPPASAPRKLGTACVRRFDALLVGLGVVDEPTIRGPIPAVRSVPYAESVAYALKQARVAEARRRVEQFLERFALRCATASVACKRTRGAC